MTHAGPAAGRRLFVALWPDPATRERLAAAAAPMLAACNARPVPPANFHVTLAFIGDSSWPDAHFAGLAAAAAGPFDLALDRFGHWPGPRVSWLGPSRCPPELAALAARVRDGLDRLGVGFDRKVFRPHVTLARKVAALPEPRPPRPVHWPVRAFALVESRTLPAGAAYRVAREFPLEAIGEGSRHDPNRR